MAQLELKIGDKTYNKAWVDNVSSTSQISSDAGSVNYGVIASTGSAKMRDINGQIRADIENGVLPISNVPTKVIINGNQIQEHITSDSDYNIIDKKLDLQFSDRLSLLDKVTYGGMPLREYSMTAYDMLDDVIGSYGGYCRERVINWTKYTFADRFSIDGQEMSVKIKFSPTSDYPVIGIPIKVTPNVQHKLSVSLDILEDYAGNARFQILNAVPTDSASYDNEIAGQTISEEEGEDLLILTFTPVVDTIYAIINFGYATQRQQTIRIAVNSIKLDGYGSLSMMTTDLMPSGLTIAGELEKRQISYPYLPSATYRETIEKFCTFMQITLALDENGKAIFHCARPIATRENTLVIPAHYKISNLQKTLFLKNKVDGVDISQSKPVETVDFGGVVQTDTHSAEVGYEDSADKRSSSGNYGVYMSASYQYAGTTIPKESADKTKKILNILSGKAPNGDNNIKHTVYWRYETGFRTPEKETITSSTTGNGDMYDAVFYNSDGTVNQDIYNLTYAYGGDASVKVTLTDNSTIGNSGVITETEQSYSSYFSVLIGKEARFFTATTDDYYNFYRFIPLSIKISYYGDIYTLDFEEVNLSTVGIENANNVVSVSTNELMQNIRAVDTIRDNIIEDYANGVPTATIDLFCGVGDWGNGEIIQPNDTVAFADDVDRNGRMNDWKVTGRTFKYQGAPTLSLELQRVKSWKKFFASTSYQIVLQSGTPPTTATEIVKTVTIDNLALDTTVPHKQTRFKGVAYNQSNKKLGDFVCYSGEPTNVFRVGDAQSLPQPFSLTITRDSSDTIICKSSIDNSSGTKQYVSGIILTEIAQFY